MKRLFLVAMLFHSGCSGLSRHPESGYGTPGVKSTQSGWRKVEGRVNTKTIPAEPVDEDQKERLKKLENALSLKKEIDQYSRALPWFKNDEEKIEFLSLPNYEVRQKWLLETDYGSRIQRIKNQMKELVEAQDIAVGMPEDLVKKSWGDPEGVDVSGNPKFKNQRWRYQKFVSTQDGYRQEKKTVYFEGGKVVGWEVE
jgi:hypothetical protein